MPTLGWVVFAVCRSTLTGRGSPVSPGTSRARSKSASRGPGEPACILRRLFLACLRRALQVPFRRLSGGPSRRPGTSNVEPVGRGGPRCRDPGTALGFGAVGTFLCTAGEAPSRATPLWLRCEDVDATVAQGCSDHMGRPERISCKGLHRESRKTVTHLCPMAP